MEHVLIIVETFYCLDQSIRKKLICSWCVLCNMEIRNKILSYRIDFFAVLSRTFLSSHRHVDFGIRTILKKLQSVLFILSIKPKTRFILYLKVAKKPKKECTFLNEILLTPLMALMTLLESWKRRNWKKHNQSVNRIDI